jgi:hypothetical protein
MDWRTFIADLVKSSAWPAAAVAMALIFRHPLAKLIPLLKKLKYKDLEADFSNILDKAEREAATVLPAPALASGIGTPVSSQDKNDAYQYDADAAGLYAAAMRVSPESAVLDAWRGLVIAIWEAIDKVGKGVSQDSSLEDKVQWLYDQKWLNSRQYRLFHWLNELRNLAAHGGEDRTISVADATRFLALAWVLRKYLHSLTPESPKVKDE